MLLRASLDLDLVTVAVRASEGVHDVTEGLVVRNEAEGNLVVELHGVAGRVVGEGGGAADDVLAAPDVKVLPDSPDLVNHGVVKEEDGVVGRGVEILELGRATTHPVSATVDTHGVVVVAIALHELLEVLNVDHVENKLGDLLVGIVGVADIVVEITGKAATVVVEVALDVLEGRADGTKVGDKVGEGAVLHAATASTRLEVDVHGVKVSVLPSGDVLAVTAHGELITVENLAVLDVTGIGSPVPVRHNTSVATKVLQILLEGVGEEAVPRQEVRGHVDLSGVVDVGGNVLVVTSEDTRVVGLLVIAHTLIRGVVQASDSIGERLAVFVGHLGELLADLGVVVVASRVAAVHVVTHAVVGSVGHIPPGVAIGNLVGVVVGDGRRLSESKAGNGGQTGQ